jgi:hypothetical protein
MEGAGKPFARSAGPSMPKKNASQRVTGSDLLRDALGEHPDLDLGEINRRWAEA